MVVVLLVVALAGAALVELPYYALEPGKVHPTAGLIYVGDAKSYPSKGSVSFATVGLAQCTLFEVIGGWLDPDIDVYTRDAVLGDRSADENRQFNQVLMDDSKLTATQVALEHLGYTVDVSITGMTVLEVQPGFPAEGELEAGEVILRIDGEPLDEPDDLRRLLGAHAPGEVVQLRVEGPRGRRERVERLELAAAPDDPGRAVLGIQIQPRDLHYDFPFDISIDSGTVSGPSAGLAYTLGLLDVLTPGELTGGTTVVATGTVDAEGNVGAIGGISQKVAAVRRAGIDVVLVPATQYEEAVDRAGDVKVFGVTNLADALEALASLGGNALALGTQGDAVPS